MQSIYHLQWKTQMSALWEVQYPMFCGLDPFWHHRSENLSPLYFSIDHTILNLSLVSDFMQVKC